MGLKGVLDVIQTLFLVLPGAGSAYTAARVGGRTATGAVSWSAGRPGRQAVLGLAATRRGRPGGLQLVAQRRVPAGPAGRAAER